MSHKQPATSLSDIHDIYQGTRPARSADQALAYKRVPFSPRDEGHPGRTPERPPIKSKVRR
ncbi:MAG TPA: hypothetical protein VGU65_10765 [Frateuria sp.]|uniref:hypothetical protein n=1 Tax=Frateuria sp. TaxID=2211372 RepID=UPI002DE3944E|nr:hypothetical protein [Frateuria sp.]